jgi:ribosomal protein L7/L12
MDDYREMHPALVATAERMRAEGRDLEEVLTALRAQCPSIIQSIKAVRDVMGIPLGEAKALVHHSSTWSDLADDFSDVHDAAEAAHEGEISEQADGSYRVQIDLTRESPE